MIKFVRDGQIVWPYCSDCGCRLHLSRRGMGIINHRSFWQHFEGEAFNQDGAGHYCPKGDLIFGVDNTKVPDFTQVIG